MTDVIPAVSVVIPLYNKEREIARAIESVLAQTFTAFEVVVVDDGSTDDGARMVDSFDDRRLRLHRQPNAGVSAARNTGIEATRADLIAFLDADDAWRPDFLANVLALVERYPSAGTFALNYEIITRRGAVMHGVESADEPTMLLDPADYFRLGRVRTPVHSSSVAVRRDVIDRAGRFPHGVRLGEDIDTWLRLCFVAPIAFDCRIGCTYQLDSGERALDLHAPTERYVFFDTIDRWVATQPGLPRAVLEDIREFKNFFTLVYAQDQIRSGEPLDGRRVLVPLKTRAFRLQRWKWLIASFLPRRVKSWITGALHLVR